MSYFFADHLGTSPVVTNAAGGNPDESDFYPFGGERVVSDTLPNQNYKFTGKERDTESNQDNFTARYFGSSLGRFMSVDPLAGHSEDPQTLNRYVYVRNNPLTLTDPTGLDFYLSCTHTKNNTSTCQQVQVGDQKVWVQGTTGDNGKFRPSVVTSASLQDPNSGNTATVNQNGVQITTAGGTSQGIFISGTPAANNIQGSGALQGFSFDINGNCNETCLSSGIFKFNGTADQARQILGQRGAWRYLTDPIFDEKYHPFTDQYRLGEWFFGGPSPHLSVPVNKIGFVFRGKNEIIPIIIQNPKATVPIQGPFHVDASTFPKHLVCVMTGAGCN